ncbi:nucleoid-associated protein YgaU [Arthrobacter sp. UYP6]|uniref:LysM peptidoglycan-binding domain-containing protein n=1 Tax=Arthrobacter sp. UYP6 TaxID=1756378 RepID=UPI003394FAF1
MRHLLRDLLTLAACAAAAAILVWAGLATRPNFATLLHGTVSSLQQLAGFAAAAAGVALALWWCTALILALASAALQKAGHAAAAAAAGALAPAFMKRIAATIIGLNLVTGIGAAQAAETFPAAGPPQSLSVLQQPTDAVVHPQWEPTDTLRTPGNPLPEIPGMSGAGAEQAADPPSPQWKPRAQQSADNVFIRPGRSDAVSQRAVREGDSLWSLAAEQLGPQASDAEIAAQWPRWYERNRAVIGDQPNLILPGQVLEIPEVPEVPRQ